MLEVPSKMKKAILGTKVGMTQLFLEDGRVVPVTVVEAGPCTVVQKKTVERDGYSAIQVGFKTLSESRAKKLKNKPEQGHFKKAGVAATRYLREFRLDDAQNYEVGQNIEVNVCLLYTSGKGREGRPGHHERQLLVPGQPEVRLRHLRVRGLTRTIRRDFPFGVLLFGKTTVKIFSFWPLTDALEDDTINS